MNQPTVKCPLCSSLNARHMADVKDVEYFTSQEDFSYFDCEDCGCVFLKDPPVDRLSEIYPDNYYAVEGPTDAKGFLSRMLEAVKNKLDRKMFSQALARIKGDKIDCLDVGGGAGWIMNLVRQSDPRVRHTTIVDINENSRTAAESNGHTYINGSIDNLTAKNEYDFVMLLNLIEHVADPRKTLSSIHASMTAKGLLLIKTPNTDSLNRRLYEKRYWGGYHAPRHWVLFNKANFFSLAKECGFEIERFEYTQGAPQWVASILGTREQRKPGSGVNPMYKHPIYFLLTLFFAAFDFVRVPFATTDQIIVLLRKR